MRREVGYLRSMSEMSLPAVPECRWLKQDCVGEINAGVTTPLAGSEDPEQELRRTQLQLDWSESQS